MFYVCKISECEERRWGIFCTYIHRVLSEDLPGACSNYTIGTGLLPMSTKDFQMATLISKDYTLKGSARSPRLRPNNFPRLRYTQTELITEDLVG